MAAESKHLHVFWSNGMQVSKDHFIASEDAGKYQTQLARAQGINPLNYGLLAASSPDEKVYELRFVSGKIELIACKAVTAGGIGIDIPAFTGHQVDLSVQGATTESETKSWAIILSIDPFKREAIEEGITPIPYAIPSYNLSLRAIDDDSSPFKTSIRELLVGKLISNGTSLQRDESYYPPCCNLSSHNGLLGDFKTFVEDLEKTRDNCIAILQTLHKKEDHDPELAESISLITEGALARITDISNQFRLHLKHQPPVFTIARITDLARFLDNILKTRPETENGELAILNYLSELGIVDVGSFRSHIDQLLSYDYDHNQLKAIIDRMDAFIKTVTKVLRELSNLSRFAWKTVDRGRIVIRGKQDHVG